LAQSWTDIDLIFIDEELTCQKFVDDKLKRVLDAFDPIPTMLDDALPIYSMELVSVTKKSIDKDCLQKCTVN